MHTESAGSATVVHSVPPSSQSRVRTVHEAFILYVYIQQNRRQAANKVRCVKSSNAQRLFKNVFNESFCQIISINKPEMCIKLRLLRKHRYNKRHSLMKSKIAPLYRVWSFRFSLHVSEQLGFCNMWSVLYSDLGRRCR